MEHAKIQMFDTHANLQWQVCTDIKLCHNSTLSLAVPVKKEVAKPESDVPCVLCEFLLKEVASHLPANFTEAELEADLKSVCAKLGALEKPCDAVVTLYAEDIYNALDGKTPPDQVGFIMIALWSHKSHGIRAGVHEHQAVP